MALKGKIKTTRVVTDKSGKKTITTSYSTRGESDSGSSPSKSSSSGGSSSSSKTAGEVIKESRAAAGLPQTMTVQQAQDLARTNPEATAASWTSAGDIASRSGTDSNNINTGAYSRLPLPEGATSADVLAGIDSAGSQKRFTTLAGSENFGIVKLEEGKGFTDLPGLEMIMPAISMVKGITATKKLAQLGTTGYSAARTTTSSLIAVNSANTAKTISWISKIALQLKKPKVIAGAIATSIVAAIGSYPFAGFLKEEALQTMGMAAQQAIRNNDIEGARAAIDLKKETLNPSLWESIKAKIPYVNVLNSLDNYYEAAQLSVAIEEKMLENAQIKAETGETDEAMWARVRAEQEAQEIRIIDYYNEQRKQMLIWEEEARAAAAKAKRAEDKKARNDDAAFWASYAEEQRRLEELERQKIMEFWIAYKKMMMKMQEDSSPSRLNFGLL